MRFGKQALNNNLDLRQSVSGTYIIKGTENTRRVTKLNIIRITNWEIVYYGNG